MIGAGVLALAWIPQPDLWWTVAPVLAGVGAGLALRALAGELLPQDTMARAGRLLSVRHAAATHDGINLHDIINPIISGIGH